MSFFIAPSLLMNLRLDLRRGSRWLGMCDGFIGAGVRWEKQLFYGRTHYTMTPWRLQRQGKRQVLSNAEILCNSPLPGYQAV
jgi:hypothetical protein